MDVSRACRHESMHRVLPDPAVSVAYCYTRDPNGIPRAPRLMVLGPKLEPVMSRYTPGRRSPR